MSYEELIISWHKRAEEEEDNFVKFIFEYLAFIAFLNRSNTDNKPDRQLIQRLKRDENIKSEFLNKVDKKSIRELIDILKENPLQNVTNNNDRWWDCDTDNCLNKKSVNDGKILNVNDYRNIIEFVYRARNNLFHGKKGSDIERDIIIVRYGFLILNPLVATLLSSKGLLNEGN